VTTARDLQARLQGRMSRPAGPAGQAAGKWPRVSLDLPPDVHEQVTRFAFEHNRVKVMHLGQALVELMLEDEELQQRVLDRLPVLRRKADQLT
jgi:hypothetical protein